LPLDLIVFFDKPVTAPLPIKVLACLPHNAGKKQDGINRPQPVYNPKHR